MLLFFILSFVLFFASKIFFSHILCVCLFVINESNKLGIPNPWFHMLLMIVYGTLFCIQWWWCRLGYFSTMHPEYICETNLPFYFLPLVFEMKRIDPWSFFFLLVCVSVFIIINSGKEFHIFRHTMMMMMIIIIKA